MSDEMGTTQGGGAQAHDRVLKAALGLFPGRSLDFFGLDLPAVAGALPTEIPQISARLWIPDYRLALEDGSQVHLEFQSTPGDLARFHVYDALWFERDRRPIHTAVIYTGPVTRAVDTLDFGSGVYRVQNVFLGNRDGDAELAILRRQLAAHGALVSGSAFPVAFLALMHHRRRSRLEAAEEALRLADALPHDGERQSVAAAVVLLVERFLAPVELTRLMGVFRLSRIGDLLLAEGKAEGKAEDILLVLGKRFGSVPEHLGRRVRTVTDLGTLDRWLSLALDAACLSDFERGASQDGRP